MQFSIHDIKLIVGLGNPGDKYMRTRHNAGFTFINEFASTLYPELNWKHHQSLAAELITAPGTSANTAWQPILAKPTTFMNLSGEAVQKILSYYRVSPAQLLVVHDDMDIGLGSYKFSFAKGPKLHNGITSIAQLLSTDDYWRLRLGIENRPVKGNKLVSGDRYALERFSEQEYSQLVAACRAIIASLHSN